MDYKYIEQLLERYWNCETSLEEEQILRSFFRQKEVPAHLLRYKQLFAYQDVEKEKGLGDDFDTRILTREKIKGQNFFRIIFYIPNILSVVVISGIFSAIYKPENGMLNSIIGLFRNMSDPILWKGEKLVIPSIIIAMVWQAIGYYMVMYMASMSAVPISLYESANLDGAGRLTQFFQITIPLIWTNIRTTLTFFIISTINMAFLFVKAMTSGGPNGASDVALSYMYSQKDAGLYGYSMAIGVVIFLFSFALSACVNKATSRDPLEF